MSSQLHTEIGIRATPQRVWEILTDFCAYPAWNPFIPDISGSTKVGSRLDVQLQPPGGRGMRMRPTVLAATPTQELRWLGHLGVPGLFDGEHRFRIEPSGTDRVRFVQEERFTGLLAPLVMRFIERGTRQGFETMNQALKARAERPSSSLVPLPEVLMLAQPKGMSPRARAIVSAARQILEREGADGLTMRRLADSVGIRAPSLYKHFPDKAAVEIALIDECFEEIAERFEAAVGNGENSLRELATAYRTFALAHPYLYRLMTTGPLPRERLRPGVEARAAAPIVQAVGDPDLARTVWAFAHGMVILELDGRFPPDADLDAAWEVGLAAFGAAGPS